jgi:hypothetical protein
VAEAKKKAKSKKAAAKAPAEVRSIKGFNRDMTCQGYQFEPGKTFEHEGAVKICRTGFHACKAEAHPLAVFDYYSPGTSRYFDVVQHGPFDSDDDVKICSAKITIGIELSISELTRRAIEWVFSRAKPEKGSSATGYAGAASATGDAGAASATGDAGAASATGDAGAASATGYAGAASATGVRGAASATGVRGAASATGVRGAASATGDAGAASATGVRGAASATGVRGAASATGVRGAASATGREGRVSGKTGCAVFAVERDFEWKITSVACGIVGQDGLKEDTWYVCRSGKLVELGNA